jgi:hypothetical protein
MPLDGGRALPRHETLTRLREPMNISKVLFEALLLATSLLFARASVQTPLAIEESHEMEIVTLHAEGARH